MANVNIPAAGVPIIRMDGKALLIEKPWYQLLQGIAESANAATAANATAVDLATADVTGILPVPNGGTGKASLTAYAPLFGGTTSTGVVQSGTVGTSGQVFTSNGASAIATFQTMTTTDSISGVIEVPAAKDYIVLINTPFAFTAVNMTTICSTGTCTSVVKKNTTATGMTNSVST